MASEPENPFARNSAWPQMPQAPFRVGPLPKADPARPGPATAAPQTVTPLYTRPLTAQPGPDPSGLITRPQPTAAPQPVREPAPQPMPEASPVAADPIPAPAAPETYVELAPLIVRPPGSDRRATPRKSPLPAIAAAGAGLAAVLGVAYALNKGQEAALRRPDPPAQAAIAPAPVVPSAPMEPERPAAATRVAAPPAVAAAKPRPAPPVVRPVRVAPAVAPTAADPPLLSLPPPAAAPAPQPSYTPPAAPDPSAPMTTQRRQ